MPSETVGQAILPAAGFLAGSGVPETRSKAGLQAESLPHYFELIELGRLGYGEAFALQRSLVERRKRGEIADQLLIVEHPHVITIGRNGHDENLLASLELLARAGIQFHRTDRGGDVTYHGPGQIVGYPIFDLREWKRDVVAYVRAVEQALIEALAEFGIAAERSPGATGVWTPGRAERTGVSLLCAGEHRTLAKIAAIGVHISRWVTSHGFALNVDTDLSYFRYIVPCGLARPVTSMRALGSQASRAQVVAALARSFGRVFDRGVVPFAGAQRTDSCAPNLEKL
jgi:lipoyl(octanoyl) transferase